jgi:hypothetical protein
MPLNRNKPWRDLKDGEKLYRVRGVVQHWGTLQEIEYDTSAITVDELFDEFCGTFQSLDTATLIQLEIRRGHIYEQPTS